MNESNVKQFCDVRARDSEGRPTIVFVPGHEGREYFVFIHRNETIIVHCNEPGVWGNRECKSNSGDHVCRHALVALEVAAADQGMTLSWCESKTAAEELTRAGGEVFHARSRQGTGEVWGMVMDLNVDNIRPIMFCVAVGNPHESEYRRENGPEAVLARGRALLHGEDVKEI